MPDKPNVLLVMADQWRAEALGCMGDEQVRTPNIDRFANDGLVFERAYTPNPVCSPARGSLFTGQYPHEHGVISNTYHKLFLPDDRTTIAECFRDAGYETGYIGKWHLDGTIDGPGYVPPDRRHGFEYWRGFNRGHPHLRGFPNVAPDGSVEWEGDREPDIETDYALEFLDETEGGPSFLTLSWGPPHTPYEAPAEYGELYDPDELTLRPNVPDEMADEVRENLVEYYGMCTWLDDEFGRLLEGLEERGLADDTVVVFTADHGDMMGGQGRYAKGVPFEESIHVPLLVRYPPEIEGGRRSTSVVNLIDLMPTLLGLCDVAVPGSVQGTDRSAHVRGEEPASSTATYLEGNLPYDDTWRAIRTDECMLAIDRTLTTTHLYDMESDPYQLENLAGDNDVADLEDELRWRLFELAYAYDDRFIKARHGRQHEPEERIPLSDGR
ncbi:sulfatase-like hydrolase/transferase [Halomontanus rarus]|uniref:sulfatase-like hydrolase/transferase n=1 Tax=Halomontanus rarus TaxID=3034020 RepID=UPI0023E8A76E|nr:sulfatase-like hydrolase/transferase [Halovivax sp. TS33]